MSTVSMEYVTDNTVHNGREYAIEIVLDKGDAEMFSHVHFTH